MQQQTQMPERTYALTNDVDGVRRLCARDTNQKVVGLNVTVDEGLLVDGLDASNLKDSDLE